MRHGLGVAAAPETSLDLVLLFDRPMRIEGERAKLSGEITEFARNGEMKKAEIALRHMAALERYARRCSSTLRKR